MFHSLLRKTEEKITILQGFFHISIDCNFTSVDHRSNISFVPFCPMNLIFPSAELADDSDLMSTFSLTVSMLSESLSSWIDSFVSKLSSVAVKKNNTEFMSFFPSSFRLLFCCTFYFFHENRSFFSCKENVEYCTHSLYKKKKIKRKKII